MTSTLHHLDRATFMDAAARAGVDDVAAQAIWTELGAAPQPAGAPMGERRQGFPRVVAILVALGSLLVIGAGSLWVALFGDSLNHIPVLVVALAAIAVCLVVATRLQRRGQGDLTSWFAALGIALVPAAIVTSGLVLGIDADSATGHDTKSVVSSIASMLGALAIFARFRTPLALLATLGMTAWALITSSMALLDEFAGQTYDGEVLFVVGLAGLALGTALDARKLRDFAMWPQVLGALATVIVGGVILPGAWWLALIVCGAGVGVLGVFVARSSLLGIGAASAWVGVVGIEPNPFTLIFSGLITIALGIWLARDGNPVRTWIETRQSRL